MLRNLLKASRNHFEDLREVEVGTNFYTLWWINYDKPDPFRQDLDQILPFFYAPHIETISAPITEPDVFEWPIQPPNATSLRRLTLRRSELQEESLRQLLMCTPRLQHLDYDYMCDVEGLREDKPTYVDAKLLSTALQTLRKTLRTLKIRIEFFSRGAYDVTEGMDGGVRHFLDSFHDYADLTSLDLPLVLLMGHSMPSLCPPLSHILPPTLKHLRLSDDLLDWTGVLNHPEMRDPYVPDWNRIFDYMQEACSNDTRSLLLEPVCLEMRGELRPSPPRPLLDAFRAQGGITSVV